MTKQTLIYLWNTHNPFENKIDTMGFMKKKNNKEEKHSHFTCLVVSVKCHLPNIKKKERVSIHKMFDLGCLNSL